MSEATATYVGAVRAARVQAALFGAVGVSAGLVVLVLVDQLVGPLFFAAVFFIAGTTCILLLGYSESMPAEGEAVGWGLVTDSLTAVAVLAIVRRLFAGLVIAGGLTVITGYGIGVGFLVGLSMGSGALSIRWRRWELGQRSVLVVPERGSGLSLGRLAWAGGGTDAGE